MKLILATRNDGKLKELQSMFFGLAIELTSLLDYPDISEIVEDGVTFFDNARKKARAVRDTAGLFSLADDSGLVVRALGGRPGVTSARYAGRQGDYAANNKKLLEEMKNVPDGERDAEFVCSMVLAAPDGREWDVEGRCEGMIIREPRGGRGGFGYDPLFLIPDKGKTMAELSLEEKNEISHRGRAFREMRKILVEIFDGK